MFDDGRYPSAAAALARRADVVIVFAHQWMIENEDAPDMSLPQGQDALISAIAKANPHTLVVLETGGAVVMPWISDVAAVLEAWYAGTGGADAIADVLFGKANPSGRLPVTFPASIDQYPRPDIPGWGRPEGEYFDAPHPEGAFVGYRWLDRNKQQPLFPFGFGLSFTNFEYQNLEVQGGKELTLSFKVTNVGGRAGADVPQVYLTSVNGSRALRLIGFRRVILAPGESQQVQLKVDPRLLARFDEHANRWEIGSGSYEVAVSSSAVEHSLTGKARLISRTLPP
jgi:beta-glucosidase